MNSLSTMLLLSLLAASHTCVATYLMYLTGWVGFPITHITREKQSMTMKGLLEGNMMSCPNSRSFQK